MTLPIEELCFPGCSRKREYFLYSGALKFQIFCPLLNYKDHVPQQFFSKPQWLTLRCYVCCSFLIIYSIWYGNKALRANEFSFAEGTLGQQAQPFQFGRPVMGESRWFCVTGRPMSSSICAMKLCVQVCAPPTYRNGVSRASTHAHCSLTA